MMDPFGSRSLLFQDGNVEGKARGSELFLVFTRIACAAF
jgi:hypothetical protein